MDIQLFALNASREWGAKITNYFPEICLASHEETEFEDGEHKTRSLVNVRGRHVFVVQSLYSDDEQSVNDKLCRLLFFIGALRDACAQQITAVIPYFAYARKDRKTKDRDPVTMKYMAQLLEAAGANAVLTMDIHNLSAFQNAFRIPTDHLEARVLFAPYLVKQLAGEDIVIVSPDAGGVKRAEQLRETLGGLTGREIGKAFLDKKRSSGVVSSRQEIIGSVRDRTAVIIDDLISTGSTIELAVEALHKQGARKILACATHGIFVGKANEILVNDDLDQIIITNTIPPFRLDKHLLDKVVVLDATLLFSEAIRQLHAGGSIVDLLQEYPGRRPAINGK
ncbi:ribose-phosphate diphosphokinase [Legionella spiritensis]|uniref:ribose-phosphate diphosphokinase n=1 Tax=Legionella spiritensis TaxID=452 RepID=UPI000F720BEC|nr:ribose-phosphate pyrophosphokinase [Legionella spiritensis]VEG90204.1 ribose-phosphate pyrophosphokinase [Legionella spiritensis]